MTEYSFGKVLLEDPPALGLGNPPHDRPAVGRVLQEVGFRWSALVQGGTAQWVARVAALGDTDLHLKLAKRIPHRIQAARRLEMTQWLSGPPDCVPLRVTDHQLTNHGGGSCALPRHRTRSS